MFFWTSLAFSMIQWMLAIWSLVPQPFLKPTWASGSSQFMYCWSLSWENFEHYFTSVWDECKCAVVWAFVGIAFLWDWNENWPFPVLWPLLSFLNLLAYWVQHFHGIIFQDLKQLNWIFLLANSLNISSSHFVWFFTSRMQEGKNCHLSCSMLPASAQSSLSIGCGVGGSGCVSCSSLLHGYKICGHPSRLVGFLIRGIQPWIWNIVYVLHLVESADGEPVDRDVRL